MKLQPRLSKLLLAMSACMPLQFAWAAGQIGFVEGNVSVTSAQGQLRVPHKGERIEPGDAITTGRDGEMHVVMDDNALVALRPNTSMRIEAYRARGDADDTAVFRLLQGSLRSITGWIGKSYPQHYAVRTNTATIGVRGTDHEVAVKDDGGGDAGTYDKVNAGETEMVTRQGKLAVLAGRAGFAPKAGGLAPRMLDTLPGLFAATRNEALIESAKQDLERTRDERLKARQQELQRQAPDSGGKPQIGDVEQGARALSAFEAVLRAFESGDAASLRLRFDPSLIGLQQLLDGMRQEYNDCKQIRVNLLDTQVQAGPDLAVVQTVWEKRCLLLPTLTPQLVTGRSTVLLHLGPQGWTLSAITPGSMLQPGLRQPRPPSPGTPPAPGAPSPAPAPSTGPAPSPTPGAPPSSTPAAPTPAPAPGTTPAPAPTTAPGTAPPAPGAAPPAPPPTPRPPAPAPTTRPPRPPSPTTAPAPSPTTAPAPSPTNAPAQTPASAVPR